MKLIEFKIHEFLTVENLMWGYDFTLSSCLNSKA